MAYSDFKNTINKYLTGWKDFAGGKSSTPTLDVKISTSYELNALKNSVSAEQMIQLGNAYYDQVALGRSIKELYKLPKDYFDELSVELTNNVNSMDDLATRTAEQHVNIQRSIEMSRALTTLSPSMQSKLSTVKSEFDA